jgi:hypothetical protein
VGGRAALATPNPESASRVVLAAVAAGVVELVITDQLEAGYRPAVEYPKVKRYAAKVAGRRSSMPSWGRPNRPRPARRLARYPPTRETTRWWRLVWLVGQPSW